MRDISMEIDLFAPSATDRLSGRPFGALQSLLCMARIRILPSPRIRLVTPTAFRYRIIILLFVLIPCELMLLVVNLVVIDCDIAHGRAMSQSK